MLGWDEARRATPCVARSRRGALLEGTMTHRRALWVLLWLSLFAVACSGSPAGSSSDDGPCASDDDCPGGGICVAGTCIGGSTDAGPAIDAGAEDTADEEDTEPPTPDVAFDLGSDADVETLGSFGDPCDSDEECASGYCIDTADGQVCTVPCVDECPDPEWECRLLPGQGADLVRLCVPVVQDLCTPCGGDIDCGGLPDLCIDYEDGSFCGRACASEVDCPEGYGCEQVDGGDGELVGQCLNLNGICGDCLDRDGDRYGEGEGCLGVDCNDEDPNTFTDAPELCDGFDNDCDDEEDEGFDFFNDASNCGFCGVTCETVRASAICIGGVCNIDACEPGFYDVNGDYEDGCEYACVQNGETGAVEICNDADDDCDGLVDEGVDTLSDPENCGACGESCALPNTDATACVEGGCVVEACAEPFADCNGLSVDGCEVDTTLDDDHCGGCDLECVLPSGTSMCVDATCVVDTCVDGYADCDEEPANGCEVNLQNDESNCGLCGNVCVATGGFGACQDGVCEVDICADGLADCDGDLETGCEVDLRTDPLHCGACGFVCDTPNATPGCAESRCTVAACDPGFYDANGLVEDGCEYACSPTGEEVCDGVDNDCDGAIDEDFDFDLDVNNCGACGQSCVLPHADAICNAGECVITRCELGFDDCNRLPGDGCEVVTSFDPLNCGTCGVVCDVENASASCFGGACVIDDCASPWEDCDTNPRNGCEANLETSEAHCGSCFGVCAVLGGVGLCDEGDCTIGLCNGDLASCDGRADNGCETDLGNDPLNCGGCGVTCATENAQTRCVDRACEVLSCDPGFRDCDDSYGNGCEVNINNDPNNCSACGSVCAFPNATSTCIAGSCSLFGCLPGFENCDGSIGNGCESSVLSDPDNCGSCGERCEYPNARGFCEEGRCTIGFCEGTYANCDFNPANGCESDLATDPGDCGFCGNTCRLDNATAACVDGGCVIDTCDPGWGDCDGINENGCEADLDADPDNCSRCGLECITPNANAGCLEGVCTVDTCIGTFADCDTLVSNGCESNLQSDDEDCGACGFDCSFEVGAETVCVGSVCQVRDCLGTTRDCDGLESNGCEVDTSNDVNNCGGCGISCNVANAFEACIGGVCEITECSSGYVDCDGVFANGCEANTNLDPNNCGGCDIECDLIAAEDICLAGNCAIGDCLGTNRDCDGVIGNGCEVNAATDALNCGACGAACDIDNAVEVCAGGICNIGECSGDYANCNGLLSDGCEVDLDSDSRNCGGCGLACTGDSAVSACFGGFCQVAACEVGYGDCDGVEANGCEVNLQTDEANCGLCGQVCAPANASGLCIEGTCLIESCIGDWEDCDGDRLTGCEANLSSSLANCGACGDVCDLPGADETCSAGACVFLGCQDGFIDLNEDPSDGCEYACTFVSDEDEPDTLFADLDCDGVDGEIESSVFVWSGGTDLNSGLAPDRPVESLARALQIASAIEGRDTILVAVGTYTSAIPVRLVSGVSIYGGYGSDFTTRTTERPVIIGESETTVIAENLTAAVVVEGVDFQNANASAPGEESVVFRVSNAGDFLLLRSVAIQAGFGGDGAAGSPGSSGRDGGSGRDASGSSGGPGGSPGVGGSGGNGRRETSGLGGSSGGDNGGASTCGGGGGSGGSGGSGCFDGNPPRAATAATAAPARWARLAVAAARRATWSASRGSRPTARRAARAALAAAAAVAARVAARTASTRASSAASRAALAAAAAAAAAAARAAWADLAAAVAARPWAWCSAAGLSR